MNVAPMEIAQMNAGAMKFVEGEGAFKAGF